MRQHYEPADIGPKRASGNCKHITGNQSDSRNVSRPAASLKAVPIPVELAYRRFGRCGRVFNSLDVVQVSSALCTPPRTASMHLLTDEQLLEIIHVPFV